MNSTLRINQENHDALLIGLEDRLAHLLVIVVVVHVLSVRFRLLLSLFSKRVPFKLMQDFVSIFLFFLGVKMLKIYRTKFDHRVLQSIRSC